MIKLIRLITGEDIISEIEKKDDCVILKKPHRLLISNEGLASMPMCPFAKNSNYEISKNNILFEADPEDEIRDSYATQVGAILVASKGLLTP